MTLASVGWDAARRIVRVCTIAGCRFRCRANSKASRGVRCRPATRRLRSSTLHGSKPPKGTAMNMTSKAEILAAATVADPRWAAVVARDAKADGSFVYSVKTTGVYCRPSCGARRPRPENVALHATNADAERAGFRPCKRCRPDQAPRAEQQAAMVADLCRHIEAADHVPSLDELAAHAGLSAHHLHRVFKARHRIDAQGLGRGASREARARRARSRRQRHRRDLRRRLQLERPLLRAIERGARHDALELIAPAAPTPTSASRSASARWDRSSSRRASAASAPSCWATTPTPWLRDLQDRFPRARLIGGDAKFEELVAKVVGFVEAPAHRPRPAARRARHRVPAARLAGAARDSTGRDRELFRDRNRASARPNRYARWPGPAPRTRWRWRSPATASCAATARSPAIAGVSSASARCSTAKRTGRAAKPSPPADARAAAIARRADERARVPDAAIAATVDWDGVVQDLDARGNASIGCLLTPAECESLVALYPVDAMFRSRVVMARHGYGRGEYSYFAYPLPARVAELRAALYPRLAPLANRWNEAMGVDVRYPARHADLPRALPRRRAATTDAPAALLRRRRLQLPAPGPVRRARVPVAGDGPALGAGSRFRRRRVRAHRAASADAVACRGRAAAPGRRGDLRRPPSARCGAAREPSRQSPARREPHPLRPSSHAGHHLPRRGMSTR